MNIAAYLAPDGWLQPKGAPRYVQLRRRLADGIAQGVVSSGDALPPEREIAALTALSRVTVRKATQALVEDGIIVQKQGSGSFVAETAPRIEQSLSRLTSFSADMARRGMAVSSVWLDRGVYVPSPDEMLALALTPHASVSRLTRLRSAGGRPMAVERAALPAQMMPDPSVVQTSLYDVLADTGLRPVRALQKISALHLEADVADMLGVPAHHAGLRIERTSYLADGRAVEFTQSTYRGDAYNFVAELRLAPD